MRKIGPRAPAHQSVSVPGSELLDYVKGLIAQGNTRRLVIRRPSGGVVVEVPLTAGIAVGGALTLLTPVLAAISAMTALVAKVQVDVVRNDR